MIASADLLVYANNLVMRDRVDSGFVLINQGQITSIQKTLSENVIREYKENGECVEYGSCYMVFPGFVDKHVHARFGQEEKETYETIGRAAIAGGVTHIGDMPNNPIGYAPINEEIYQRKVKAASECPVGVSVYGAVTNDGYPFPGPPVWKLYTESVGPPELHFKNYRDIENTLKHFYLKKITVHCEDYYILQQCKNEAVHELRRPAVAENTSIRKVIDMYDNGLNKEIELCIAHISTAEGLSMIPDGVYNEITIQHATFDASMIDKLVERTGYSRNFLNINPALRTPYDRDFLLNHLTGKMEIPIDHRLTCIVTDHAPHTYEQKDMGMSGYPGVEHFGHFAGHLIWKHDARPQRIAQMASLTPAEYLGIPRGIEIGRPGTLTALDFSERIVPNGETYSKAGWDIWKGFELMCAVKETIINGNRMMGRIVT